MKSTIKEIQAILQSLRRRNIRINRMRVFYKNLGGNSSVIAYEIIPDAINVWFKGNKRYRYSYAKAGKNHVENMKKLACYGRGLCSYIQKNVKYLYD